MEGEASEDAEGRAVEGDDLGLSEGDELAAAVACGQLLAVGGVGADEGREGGDGELKGLMATLSSQLREEKAKKGRK